MPPTDFRTATVWTLIAVLGAGVYVFRVSFIHFYSVVNDFPPWLKQGLTFVPVAILAALIAPSLVTLDGSITDSLLSARTVAGALALGIAWRTDSMIATIGLGMGVLWAVSFLLG